MLKSIACNLTCLADNIMNPHIINPLPSIRRTAEKIYQEFISSEEGKGLFDSVKKKFSGNVPAMVEELVNSLRDRIMTAAKDNSDKFQLIRAYVRDKYLTVLFNTLLIVEDTALILLKIIFLKRRFILCL